MTDFSRRTKQGDSLLSSLCADLAFGWCGALSGSLMAWFMVEWPAPPGLVMRVIGWAFFVSWGAGLGLLLRRTV